jgi:hypothetical protein
VALAGLAWLVFGRQARTVQALGFACPAVAAVMLASGRAKPYYLAPIYPVLFAAGAVGIESWTADRQRPLVRGLVLVLLISTGAALAPFAKPLLPVETYIRYAAMLGLEPAADERHRMGRLPQHFADMHGWPGLAATVAAVHRTLPPEERARACIFGQNYGEAGAIDFFGPRLGLPKAISGHNSYFLWGPRNCTGDIVIVIGDDRESLAEVFEDVEQAATFRCANCMPYESNLPIWIVRRMRFPMAEIWPQTKHYE